MFPLGLSEMLSAAGVAGVPGLPAGLTGMSADSRSIKPGMLYAALPGSRVDGRAFIAETVARGAAARCWRRRGRRGRRA